MSISRLIRLHQVIRLRRPLHHVLTRVVQRNHISHTRRFFNLFIRVVHHRTRIVSSNTLLITMRRPSSTFLQVIQRRMLSLLNINGPIMVIGVSLRNFSIHNRLIQVVRTLHRHSTILHNLPSALRHFSLQLSIASHITNNNTRRVNSTNSSHGRSGRTRSTRSVSPTTQVQIIMRRVSDLPYMVRHLPPFQSLIT